MANIYLSLAKRSRLSFWCVDCFFCPIVALCISWGFKRVFPPNVVCSPVSQVGSGGDGDWSDLIPSPCLGVQRKGFTLVLLRAPKITHRGSLQSGCLVGFDVLIYASKVHLLVEIVVFRSSFLSVCLSINGFYRCDCVCCGTLIVICFMFLIVSNMSCCVLGF